MLLEIVKYGLGVIGAGVTGYLGGYLKKKAEDRAVQENFNELLRQTGETTERTKGIEAKISNDVWDRQKRWELKRDIVFELARKAGREIEGMTQLHAVYTTEKRNQEKGLPERTDRRLEVGKAWNDIAAEFEGMQLLVAASCGRELIKALGEFGVFMRTLSLEIIGGKPESFDAAARDIVSKSYAITQALRQELDIPSEPKKA